jgi:hypothetical protein
VSLGRRLSCRSFGIPFRHFFIQFVHLIDYMLPFLALKNLPLRWTHGGKLGLPHGSELRRPIGDGNKHTFTPYVRTTT